MIPRPTRIVSVAAAAWVAATNGSNRRLYSRGSSPPAGYGVARLAGMWVCSGKNTDSNPSASARVASHAGVTDSSVAKIARPRSMAQSWVASVGIPSSTRPVSSQVAGATSMCCVAAWASRKRRCSGLDS